VAEIIEELAWLTSALSTSPPHQDVATNDITVIVPRAAELSITSSEDSTTVVMRASCRVRFASERLAIDTATNGFCWSSLLDGATMVSGYPILNRDEYVRKSGLEVTLVVMSHLIGSNEIVKFDDMIILKGSSKLLVTTSLTESTITWHLLSQR
jgi:hypothetical protein